MIKEIEKAVFLERKPQYALCIGAGTRAYYEIIIAKNKTLALLSEGIDKPQHTFWQRKDILLLDKFVYIVDENLHIQEICLLAPVYEVLCTDEKAVIMGEIDIVVLNRDCEEISRIELSDILTGYDLQQGILRFEMMDGRTGEIKI